MNKTKMPGVMISSVERTHPWWRYFWPFYSRRQLLVSIFLLVVGTATMGGLIYLLDPHAMGNAMIGAALGGGGWGLYPLLPARLTLSTRSDAGPHIPDIQARLTKLGYVESEQPQPPDRLLYRSKRPRFWRWDEQDIEVLVHNQELVLNGPVTVLCVLRARLLLPDDRAYLKA